MKKLFIETSRREDFIEITDKVEEFLANAEFETGFVNIFTRHTTCGITINENADEDVKSDLIKLLAELAPRHKSYFKHAEQNSDAHAKASLIGSSATVPFENRKLLLGRWQGIFLCEFDGPRKREVIVGIIEAR
ncbi:MAG TPA: secondary thiamine-phosphate synthase enzyme YjbQ [Pyrinomonadaceae bacterium]|jgi:secondary thiamine-phosphate synthase enzyme|nr:secondary thiamine-phosphate synthase enzyme YjbQ [Pyrinomonadaceae bacterium]